MIQNKNSKTIRKLTK